MEQESRAANDANDANAAGITLIELLVVMVIIALFATIVGSRVGRSVDKAKHVAAKSQISEYESMLDQFKLDVGRYPTNEEGLQALRVRPANVPNWDGPYSKKDLQETSGRMRVSFGHVQSLYEMTSSSDAEWREINLKLLKVRDVRSAGNDNESSE